MCLQPHLGREGEEVESLFGSLTLFQTYISVSPALHSTSQGQKCCHVLPPWKDQVCRGVLLTAHPPTSLIFQGYVLLESIQ